MFENVTNFVYYALMLRLLGKGIDRLDEVQRSSLEVIHVKKDTVNYNLQELIKEYFQNK